MQVRQLPLRHELGSAMPARSAAASKDSPGLAVKLAPGGASRMRKARSVVIGYSTNEYGTAQTLMSGGHYS